jgi:outer membrane protein assembly factor BamE (lipoprotein component of BamABCDE complex)
MARFRPLVNAHRTARAAALLAALASLAGCALFAAPSERRGNLVDTELLQQVNPGVQTRDDIVALLGSPTATSTFDDTEWFYISGISRIRPMRSPGIEDQRVVAISFDRGGVVRQVREVGSDEQQAIRPVERTTPVPGNDRTVLQALFGNIGRVGAPGAGGRGPGGGPIQ